MMHFPLDAAKAAQPFTKYPKLQAYLERLEAEPAYKKAVERGEGSNDFGVFLK